MNHRILSYLLYSVIMAAPLTASAQADSTTKQTPPPKSKHFLSASFATLTGDYLLDGYRPGRPTEYDYANKGPAAALCLTYRYELSKRVYIGVTGVVEQQNGDWLDNEIPGGNVFDLRTYKKGQFIRTCYTLGADFTYDYAHTDIFRAYLVTGIGVTYDRETDQYTPDFYNTGYFNGVNSYGAMRARHNRTHFNTYFSPIGISVGKRLCYFFELGFGYRGVVNTGLSYALK